MLQPNIVIFYVENPAASAAFYRRLLGTDPLEQSPNFVMFALSSGMMFGLWSREEVVPVVQTSPGAAELAITLENHAAVEHALEEWRALGDIIAQEPIELDFGYGFAVRDPDGYTVRVFTPGASE